MDENQLVRTSDKDYVWNPQTGVLEYRPVIEVEDEEEQGQINRSLPAAIWHFWRDTHEMLLAGLLTLLWLVAALNVAILLEKSNFGGSAYLPELVAAAGILLALFLARRILRHRYLP